MSETAPNLEQNLSNLQRGARGFRVLSLVLTVIGVLLLGAGGLKLLRLLREIEWSVLADALQTASGCLIYFLLAWLARRAADAFVSISALIKEIGEIV
jgi:hypothetical protein